MKIAVLGATGHMAKCAIHVFAKDAGAELYLFSRSENRLKSLKAAMGLAEAHCAVGYENFGDTDYDVIFNGVGVWDTPGASPRQIFEATERYDNLILHYQTEHPAAISIHVSSGAVYGGDFSSPADRATKSVVAVNAVKKGDFYTAAKLNSEIKHRAFSELNIVDLRLFGFFSRYMSLKYNYLLAAMIGCVENGTVFESVAANFYRDYIHLDDFSELLRGVVKEPRVNTVIDVRSKAPISKDELLELFAKKYGLKFRVRDDFAGLSLTGIKPYYYSARITPVYTPRYSSRETVENELEYFLGKGRV